MKIAILGCGWLGLPLAVHFIAKGYKVNGSTTSSEKLKELKDRQIQPFLIEVTEEGIIGDFDAFIDGAEVLVIDMPPGLRSNTNVDFVKKMQHVVDGIKKTFLKVIFVSSTSVYGDHQGAVTELTLPEPETESGKQLLACEDLFLNKAHFQSAIVRFGGLFGPGRHPVKFLSGRKNVKQKYHYVHLIHLEDCIGVIDAIVAQQAFPILVNALHPNTPKRHEYYVEKALQLGIPEPEFAEQASESAGKHIESVAINSLNYQFQKDLFS